MQKLKDYPAYIRGAFGSVIAYIFGQPNNRNVLDVSTVKTRKPRECGVCHQKIEKAQDCALLDCSTGVIPKNSKRFSIYLHANCYDNVICAFIAFIEKMHNPNPKPEEDLWNITKKIIESRGEPLV